MNRTLSVGQTTPAMRDHPSPKTLKTLATGQELGYLDVASWVACPIDLSWGDMIP
jgi:hypothetical protein